MISNIFIVAIWLVGIGYSGRLTHDDLRHEVDNTFDPAGDHDEANRLVMEAELGSAVELPCKLPTPEWSSTLEGGPESPAGDRLVRVWKHGPRRILFAGELRVRHDPRLRVTPASGLIIDRVEARDGGEYICQAESIETEELLTARVRLVVLQPARAKVTPSGGVITVKSGTSLVLGCAGSGVPMPTVSWLRDGVVVAESSAGNGYVDLPLKTVNWQAGGLYQCRADNGVGGTHIQNYTVHVLHAPIVEILPPDVELRRAEAGSNSCRIQIQCLVYANPTADIKWYHNGLLLRSADSMVSSTKIGETRKSRRGAGAGDNNQVEVYGDGIAIWSLEYLQVLQLQDCDEQRLGRYNCVAENNQGRAEAEAVIEEHHLASYQAPEEVVVVRVDRQIAGPAAQNTAVAPSTSFVAVVLTSLTARWLSS